MVLHSCLLLSHLPPPHSHPREIFIFADQITFSLCLLKKPLIKEYGSAFLPFIIPSLNLHQKTSQRNVWSSQPVAIFPVMKQLAANLVISNTNSLTPEFHYISPRLAQHHRGIPVWFNILAFYHPIPHPLEKSSTSQKIAIITITNDSSPSQCANICISDLMIFVFHTSVTLCCTS